MLSFLLTWSAMIPTITSQGWVVRVDGQNHDQVNGLAVDNQSNLFAVGYFASPTLNIYSPTGQVVATLTNTGSSDSFIIKYASNGSFLWVANQGGVSSDNVDALIVDSTGNVVVAGSFSSSPLTIYNAYGMNVTSVPNNGIVDGYVVKYSSNGQFMWVSSMGGSYYDYYFGLATDATNSVILTGLFESTSINIVDSKGSVAKTIITSSYGGFVVQYLSNGSFGWVTRQDGTGIDQSSAVTTDYTGNVYVAGYYYQQPIRFYDSSDRLVKNLPLSGTSFAGFLVKYSNNGSFDWAARQDGTGYDYSKSVTVDGQLSCYVTGQYASNPLVVYDTNDMPQASVSSVGLNGAFLAKYSYNGSLTWALKIDGAGDDLGLAVTTDSLGNVMLAGSFTSNPLYIYSISGNVSGQIASSGLSAAFAVKFTSSGSFVWATRQHGSSSDQALSLAVDTGGSLYVGGSYLSSQLTIYDNQNIGVSNIINAGGQSGFIVKYNSDGSYLGKADSNATLLVSTTSLVQSSLTLTSSIPSSLEFLPSAVVVTSTQSFSQINSGVPSSSTIETFQVSSSTLEYGNNPAIILTLNLQSQSLTSVITTSQPSVQNSQSRGFEIQIWVWVVIGAGALMLSGMALMTCFYCKQKTRKPYGKPDNLKTILDDSTSLNNGTTMLNQTIPMGDTSTEMTSSTASNSQYTAKARQALKGSQMKSESFTQVIPYDQGNEPYLTQSD